MLVFQRVISEFRWFGFTGVTENFRVKLWIYWKVNVAGRPGFGNPGPISSHCRRSSAPVAEWPSWSSVSRDGDTTGTGRKIIWLVVSTYPSEKWWSESQLGWWNSQYDGKNNPNVPNHQPDMFLTSLNIGNTSITHKIRSCFLQVVGPPKR